MLMEQGWGLFDGSFGWGEVSGERAVLASWTAGTIGCSFCSDVLARSDEGEVACWRRFHFGCFRVVRLVPHDVGGCQVVSSIGSSPLPLPSTKIKTSPSPHSLPSSSSWSAQRCLRAPTTAATRPCADTTAASALPSKQRLCSAQCPPP